MTRNNQDRRDERVDNFTVDRDGCLVRSVVPKVGKAYEHRCTYPAFKRVCWRFDTHGRGDTIETIAAAENIPITQADVAVAFLIERGSIIRERRLLWPQTIDVFLDGVAEYRALELACHQARAACGHRATPAFDERDCSGVFDGNQVISEADPGL